MLRAAVCGGLRGRAGGARSGMAAGSVWSGVWKGAWIVVYLGPLKDEMPKSARAEAATSASYVDALYTWPHLQRAKKERVTQCQYCGKKSKDLNCPYCGAPKAD